MKRFFAWLLFAALLLQTATAYAESRMRIENKSYDLEVRDVYMHTSANGKYRVLRTEKTTGVQRSVRSIVLEYDFEAQAKECVGRYEENAPLALVTVDGFDERLEQLKPEEVVLTVNGLPLETDEQSDVHGHIGWEDVYRDGGRSAVFPVVLTKEGGVYDFTVCVQGLKDGVRITETAEIQVKLINTHEYKPEKEIKIVRLASDDAEAYIVGDTIYADYPQGSRTDAAVKLYFADEEGKPLDCIAWAVNTVCKAENAQAALYLKEEVRLDKDGAAEYQLKSGCERERREKVCFVLETAAAIYRTKEYRIIERFDVRKEDPEGIRFAQAETILRAGDVYEPVVLGIKNDEVLRSGLFGTFTLEAEEYTDAKVIDFRDGHTVIAVKPGTAYITARFERNGAVYKAASMKITVMEDCVREMTVLCRNLNVRAGAGMEADKVGMLRRGDSVQVVSVENGWAQLADGCYVSAKYIK